MSVPATLPADDEARPNVARAGLTAGSSSAVSPALPPKARAFSLARLRSGGRALTFPILIALLGVALLLNVGMGAVEIGPLQVFGILLKHAGIGSGIEFTTQQDAVLWNIRVPRVILGLATGASLAIAGCALQGVFRNPLADPGVIGVSSGAALGAIGIIMLGAAPFGAYTLPAAAFVGGLLLTLGVYAMARRDGRTEVVTLILTGVAANAVAGGVIGFLTFYANDAQLRNIVFWSLGSVGGASWETAKAAVVVAFFGVLLLSRFGRRLNLLALGEREAFHLGVDPERTRLAVIGLAALLTGAAVAFAGIVGFVGLVVPHLLRLMMGPDHRRLLPASALFGASLLLLADLISRTIVIPRELPLGVITALVGGPYFLWLIHRTRGRQGAWA